MRAILLASALFLAVLAGCADGPDETPMTDVGDPEPQFEDPDKDFQVDHVGLPRDPPAAGERNLESVPQWRLGEWWQYRVNDQFTGGTRDVYRIVAGTEHGNYLVGFPADDFSNDVLVLHVPGYGDIKADDISYDAHDVPYVPLQFPLREGESWQTSFEAENNVLTFVVDSVDEANQTATLSASGGQGQGTFTYDAEAGEITRWISPGYADYEVIDHGYNYSGTVRVPHDHKLVFLNGRAFGVQDLSMGALPGPNNFAPAGPDETISVDGLYDQVSFAIILQDIGGAAAQGSFQVGTAPGYYSVTATAPDGTSFSETLTPADGAGIKVSFFGHEGPVGDWNVRSLAGGAGVAMIEGIGYHSIDIEMPSGCVVQSQNAQHHAGLEC